MKQSQLFYTPQKQAPKDAKAISHQLLVRAGFVDQTAAGIFSLLPLGWRSLKKIENIIRAQMVKAGGQELFLPALHPKANWQTTGRWDSYDALYKIKQGGKEYALGPTHEEIIVPLARKYIKSYKDLPVALFQIQDKFRQEARAKSGLLRGREFLMKDLYSFHQDEKDLDAYYAKMQQAYFDIFRAVGIGEQTFLTFASGGTFSKYSHEFQTVTAAGEDIIHICPQCKIAVNQEIIQELEHKCPECGRKDLVKNTAIEVGNIFKLKTKYSQPFGLEFVDEKGQKQLVTMGCYGIGLPRLLATIVEINHDAKGIVWPAPVAPWAVHLILLSEKQAVRQSADKICALLAEHKMEVLYDDRISKSAGEKLAEADLLGLPWRVIVSDKTRAQGKIELKARQEGQGELIDQQQLLAKINV